MTTVAIISDIHFAGPEERERHDYPYLGIDNPFRRFLYRQFRHWIWQRDPFEHNYLLDRFIDRCGGADAVVANGDYSCDSAGVGLSDPASFQSAALCLDRLREAFGQRFHAVMGDHELGKLMMSSGRGGLRLESIERATAGLAIQPFWRRVIGRTVLIGVTSTLVAMPVFEIEALESERGEWWKHHRQHLDEIEAAFDELRPEQSVILFCHDPTALPFLWTRPSIRAHAAQIERTVIGHLHSKLVFDLSRLFHGMPELESFGHTPRRLSRALRNARDWAPFRPILCPSPAGSELLKDGGFLELTIDETGELASSFSLHRLVW